MNNNNLTSQVQLWKLDASRLTFRPALRRPISFNQVKGISSPMMQINMQESKRLFSSGPTGAPKISQNPDLIRDIPQFITGFTDAEGCFNISIFKDSTFKFGWRVKLTFIISLHSKDKEILE